MDQIQSVSDSWTKTAGNCDDHEYDSFLERIQRRFSERTESGARPLFTTDADADGGLFDAYLDAFPADQRQFHNCNACKRFVRAFGSLVVIEPTGATSSAVYEAEDAPEMYRASIAAILKRVRRAKVTGVFLSGEPTWGFPETGIWRHMAVKSPRVFKHSLLTANQAMAEKREEYGTVGRGLADFSAEHIATAVTLLKSDALYRSEKVLGAAEWLLKLHVDRGKSHHKNNVLWLAVAQAPAGFCHPRSSMIGTLLEDIASGLDFAEVSRKFAAKMHPLAYQRPQAAPSAGNIAQAEKIFATMGLGESLKRRFARLDDLVTVWRPTEREAKPESGGLFAHLTAKEEKPAWTPTGTPTIAMTWEKFARTVLPTAESIEILVPATSNFSALVTAENADAPPILQWDTLEQRNPVSQYVWNGGSRAAQWGLTAGVYAKVNAITLTPSMWHNPERYAHHSKGVTLIVDGARETRFDGGLGLFAELLKSELHAVRSTIEAYSASGKLGGAEQASACGIALQGAGSWAMQSPLLRVTSAGQVVSVKLDRWD